MFLQGNLQAVFDALHTIGAIDPVLKMDWNELTEEMKLQPEKVETILSLINSCSGQQADLIQRLSLLDEKSVYFLAMEVAREFSEFQDRKELH